MVDVHLLAAQVASFLPYTNVSRHGGQPLGWYYVRPNPERPTHGADVAHTDGRIYRFTFGTSRRERNRIVVRGILPSHDSKGRYVPSETALKALSFAPDTSARKILDRIERIPSKPGCLSFSSEYAIAYGKALAAIARTNQDYESIETARAKLAREFPRLLSSSPYRDAKGFWLNGNVGAYGSIGVDSEDSLKIDISGVPFEAALACLRALSAALESHQKEKLSSLGCSEANK